jgi:hypothetical protein
MPRTSRRVALPADTRAPIQRRTQRERQVIDQWHDLVVPGRCPLCRHVLVARLGRGGPFFACGCGAASLDSSPAIAEDGGTKPCWLNNEFPAMSEEACSVAGQDCE